MRATERDKIDKIVGNVLTAILIVGIVALAVFA